jgi:hypothetical protein
MDAARRGGYFHGDQSASTVPREKSNKIGSFGRPKGFESPAIDAVAVEFSAPHR